MGVKICAEGVETKEELEKIRNLGADYIQGYYYGRPVGHMDFWKLITAQMNDKTDIKINRLKGN